MTTAEIAATPLWFAAIGVVVAIGRSGPISGLAAGFVRSPTVLLVMRSTDLQISKAGTSGPFGRSLIFRDDENL